MSPRHMNGMVCYKWVIQYVNNNINYKYANINSVVSCWQDSNYITNLYVMQHTRVKLLDMITNMLFSINNKHLSFDIQNTMCNCVLYGCVYKEVNLLNVKQTKFKCL